MREDRVRHWRQKESLAIVARSGMRGFRSPNPSPFCKHSLQPITIQDSVDRRKIFSITCENLFVGEQKSLDKKDRPIREYGRAISVIECVSCEMQ